MKFKGYLYLDIDYPLVAWEAYRGGLISADQGSDLDILALSMWMANTIFHRRNFRLLNELFIDHVREAEFPEKISRLRGLFMFFDLDSAIKAEEWGGHFRNENLVEIIAETKFEPTKVDADWITYAKINNRGLINKEYIHGIRKYWNGEPYSSQPHWEYIINGRAKIINNSLMTRAFKTIKHAMPDSLKLFEISRIANMVGFDLGHCIPSIFRISENEFELMYIINLKNFQDRNFHEKLRTYCGPIKYNELNSVENLYLPDLTKYFVRFKTSETSLYGLSSLKIHSQ